MKDQTWIPIDQLEEEVDVLMFIDSPNKNERFEIAMLLVTEIGERKYFNIESNEVKNPICFRYLEEPKL